MCIHACTEYSVRVHAHSRAPGNKPRVLPSGLPRPCHGRRPADTRRFQSQHHSCQANTTSGSWPCRKGGHRFPVYRRESLPRSAPVELCYYICTLNPFARPPSQFGSRGKVGDRRIGCLRFLLFLYSASFPQSWAFWSSTSPLHGTGGGSRMLCGTPCHPDATALAQSYTFFPHSRPSPPLQYVCMYVCPSS